MSNPPSTVDDYINQFNGEAKARLLQLRELITTEVPEAQEGIMYAIVGYKLQGKPLVYFGAYPHHIGLYATPSGHTEFEKELSTYKQGKGSVQFPLDQPLPIDLIKRIVQYRKASLS